MRQKIVGASTLIAALVVSATPLAAEGVENTSYTTAGGMRVLQHEIVVDTPRDKVWEAFSTAEGWTSWVAPVAFVDFRRGGTIETSYDPNAQRGDPANIRSEILSYLPGRMLSLQAVQTPPGFPHPELADGLWSVFLFEDVEKGRTRIIAAGAGYGAGESYDTIFRFFERANAMALQQLDRRLREGPVDWDQALEAMARPQASGPSPPR